MIDAIVEHCEENPHIDMLHFWLADGTNNHCECEKCSAIIEEEGSAAGPLLRFVNRIAEAVAPLYPNVTIDTLAYNYSLPAPKIQEATPHSLVSMNVIYPSAGHKTSFEILAVSK